MVPVVIVPNTPVMASPRPSDAAAPFNLAGFALLCNRVVRTNL